MPETPASITVQGLAHIGIRVHDLARSVAFYQRLGFTKTAGPIGPVSWVGIAPEIRCQPSVVPDRMPHAKRPMPQPRRVRARLP